MREYSLREVRSAYDYQLEITKLKKELEIMKAEVKSVYELIKEVNDENDRLRAILDKLDMKQTLR